MRWPDVRSHCANVGSGCADAAPEPVTTARAASSAVPALTASEPQLHERHVAPALLDQALEIGVCLVARVAHEQPPHVAGGQFRDKLS